MSLSLVFLVAFGRSSFFENLLFLSFFTILYLQKFREWAMSFCAFLHAAARVLEWIFELLHTNP